MGLSFYTDDPTDPIAGFGEQVRLPIPDTGETVTLTNEVRDDETTVEDPQKYRVVDRNFEYRTVEYSGFSGEGRRQTVVIVTVEVESIRDD